MNIHALKNRTPDSYALKRFDEVARIITGKTSARADDAIDWIHELCSHMNVRPLSLIGVGQEHFPDIVAKARGASSMKGNPIVLTDEELTQILVKAR
jgi:alcohol dehydrogenase class IV